MNVDTPTEAYTDMEARRDLPRKLMGGTAAMRTAGRVYLPQQPAESDRAYMIRLQQTTLYNAYKRTAKNMTGKVFSKPIALKSDMPEKLVQFAEDIDLTGRHLNVFSRDVFEAGLHDGLSFILVDVPRSVENATKRDEQVMNIRPYFIHVPACDVIGWRSEVINNRSVLTQVRIKESATIPEGAYGETTRKRIRVLSRGSWELWEENDDNEFVLIEQGVNSLPEIPLAVFYANRVGFMRAYPALEDLAYLNLTHWQSTSDQRHILHFARTGVYFGSGLDEEKKVEIGMNRMIQGPIGSDLKVVEHNGKGIDAGRADLDSLKEEMRLFGLDMLTPKPGNATATGRAIDAAEMMSPLQTMALDFGDCLEQAFQYAAQYIGLEAGSVVMNADYGVSLRDASEIDVLLKARQSGDISRETFWDELKRRGLLMDDFDPELEAQRVADEAPAPLAIAA